jgi:hypothetical protein
MQTSIVVSVSGRVIFIYQMCSFHTRRGCSPPFFCIPLIPIR